MWGWIVSLITTLVGTALVWYYRTRSVDNKVAALLKENTAVLTSVNSLLQAIADEADAAAEEDAKEAGDVSTAKEASDFLNSSSGPELHQAPGTGARATTQVRPARGTKPSNPVHGFARGQGDDDPEGSLRPGSVDEGREEMAQSCPYLPAARS